MEAAARRFDFEFSWSEFDWSCERFHSVGEIMPVMAWNNCVILMRSISVLWVSRCADHVSLWNLLIPMRRV
ncbi:MAG: hypothetical protein Ct9H300mP14_08550 [Gammaproteobacteria bacterium]|nr:MAG: hypothetical protein Ct9H300mP14_08550 [Gammaproteobacteria bacterium]